MTIRMKTFHTSIKLNVGQLFSSPEPKAHKVSLWDGTRAGVRASMRACVRASTLSNMNISETSRPITIKFYLKHPWGGGKAASDQNSGFHIVIMGKRASSRFLGCF